MRELLVPSNTDPWPEVRDDLNHTPGLVELLQSRIAVATFRSFDHYVRERVRGSLVGRSSANYSLSGSIR